MIGTDLMVYHDDNDDDDDDALLSLHSLAAITSLINVIQHSPKIFKPINSTMATISFSRSIKLVKAVPQHLRYMASYERVVSECRIEKDVERSERGLILRYYSGTWRD
jgi:hypothetical protein